jgi:hypothetical protein
VYDNTFHVELGMNSKKEGRILLLEERGLCRKIKINKHSEIDNL